MNVKVCKDQHNSQLKPLLIFTWPETDFILDFIIEILLNKS